MKLPLSFEALKGIAGLFLHFIARGLPAHGRRRSSQGGAVGEDNA
jgi:hypothetical protein